MRAAAEPLSEWLARLEKLSPLEIDLGLERVERVLERLSLQLPRTVIHVAGTNGKGSCVAMLASLLQTTGACVGSYTSPHMCRYNERIRIDGREASDKQIVAAFERVEDVRQDEALTYFEYGTLAAMVVFVQAGVEAAVLEVGMGGRLDAVNVFEPDAGLITNIALDHCDWLGNDVETIAREKAGIMRRDKPVVFGSREVPQSILSQADATGARLLIAGRDYDWSVEEQSWSWRGSVSGLERLAMPGLPGDHQLENAAAVLALVEACGRSDLLQAAAVNECLAALRLDGRMQEIDAGGKWLLDVAHNPAAATALATQLQARQGNGKTLAIVGILDDKDVEGIAGPLAGHVDHWIATTAESPRAIEAGELARRIANVSNAGCLVTACIESAMDRARELATADDLILVTGSFYLVGPALERLR